MSAVFKALADPTRREILRLLRVREHSAGELAEHVTVSKPTLSGHLAVLRAADLVEAEKTGTTITYRLKMSVLEEALMEFAGLFGIRAAAGKNASVLTSTPGLNPEGGSS
jgi:DNA-binding transcriptional ArsR family regulator